MNHHTGGKIKKWLIALLLFISCIISIAILAYSANESSRELRNFAQADSLIQHTLRQFNVDRNQIRISAMTVDSSFVRKTYAVEVPSQFSKTLLHAQLNRTFHPLAVRTPAHVSLPDERMTIHLAYKGTVFRTLRLQTDNDLILDRNAASLLVAFTSTPSAAMMDAVIRFGEPIPVALQVNSGEQAREQLNNISRSYRHLSFWIMGGTEESGFRTTIPLNAVLKHLPDRSSVLSFQDISALSSPEAAPVVETVSQKNMNLIDVSEATILDADLGETFFKQELDKFADQARRQQQPVVIVMGDEQSLQWLREKLAALKKSGLHLIHPPEIHY